MHSLVVVLAVLEVVPAHDLGLAKACILLVLRRAHKRTTCRIRDL